MNNQKLADKIIKIFEKEKFDKVYKLLIKNRNNEELFDILINTDSFNNVFFRYHLTLEVMQVLSESIQKKIIDFMPRAIMLASDEIRNDRVYMENLQYKFDTNNEEINVYDYLGPKLVNDKEYILSIMDRSPLSFLQNIERTSFNEEILKNFFDNHPNYFNYLPDNLKYDYEYVLSLVDKLSIEEVIFGFSCMDYDYLKVYQIKDLIIRYVGIVNYNKILIYSLAENTEQLDKISSEEFKKLILLAPDSFFDVKRFQGIFKVGNQKKNIDLIQAINKMARLHYKDIDTPLKLSRELYQLSSKIEDGLSYDEISRQVNLYWKEIDSWISSIDKWHELDDGSLDKREDSRSFYNIYNLLIGIESNKLEQMFKVFINAEERASFFASGIKNFNVTEENLDFLRMASTCELFNSDSKSINMYNKIFLRVVSWNNDPYITLGFVNNLSKDYNIHELLINENVDEMDMDLLLNLFGYISSNVNSFYKIKSLEELRDYQKFIDDCVSKMSKESLPLYKESLLLKYFQIDRSVARLIIHSYLSDYYDSSLYQNMPEVKYLKESLDRILKSGSISELEKIDEMLNSLNKRISFRDVYSILNNIKNSYGQEINDSLLSVSENSGVIDVTDISFNMLVHVVGAYGSILTDDVWELWNTKEMTSNISICTSFISDNNLGIAPTNEHSVILGFSDLQPGFLEIMSSSDLFSVGFDSYRECRFQNVQELKDNTRHGHNEIVIRRRKGDFSEEKVMPSYIVCFDSINEESRDASVKFRIPIIFVDREKVAKRNYEEIHNRLEKFRKTLDHTLISKIICEQENNKAGLRLTRPDLMEKYFSKDIRQRNIDVLYKSILDGLSNNRVDAINSLNEFIRVILLEVDKFKVTKETPMRKNTFDIDYKEYLENYKTNPNYRENFDVSKELTSVELYNILLESRERLSDETIIDGSKRGM